LVAKASFSYARVTKGMASKFSDDFGWVNLEGKNNFGL